MATDCQAGGKWAERQCGSEQQYSTVQYSTVQCSTAVQRSTVHSTQYSARCTNRAVVSLHSPVRSHFDTAPCETANRVSVFHRLAVVTQ